MDIQLTCNQGSVLTPYYTLEGRTPINSDKVSTNAGVTIFLSPVSAEEGHWTWTGPNGFTFAGREVTLPTITPQMGGVYTANFTSNGGCTSTLDMTVTAGCAPVTLSSFYQIDGGSWINGTKLNVKSGSTIKFGPQPTGSTWKWTGPNNYLSFSRDATLTGVTPAMSGIYTGTYTNATGCEYKTEMELMVDDALGLSGQTPQKEGFRIYPNPAKNGHFSIFIPEVSSKESVDLTIFDISGRTIYSKKQTVGSGNLPLGIDAKAGTYFVNVKSGDFSQTKSLIIK